MSIEGVSAAFTNFSEKMINLGAKSIENREDRMKFFPELYTQINNFIEDKHIRGLLHDTRPPESFPPARIDSQRAMITLHKRLTGRLNYFIGIAKEIDEKYIGKNINSFGRQEREEMSGLYRNIVEKLKDTEGIPREIETTRSSNPIAFQQAFGSLPIVEEIIDPSASTVTTRLNNAGTNSTTKLQSVNPFSGTGYSLKSKNSDSQTTTNNKNNDTLPKPAKSTTALKSTTTTGTNTTHNTASATTYQPTTTLITPTVDIGVDSEEEIHPSEVLSIILNKIKPIISYINNDAQTTPLSLATLNELKTALHEAFAIFYALEGLMPPQNLENDILVSMKKMKMALNHYNTEVQNLYERYYMTNPEQALVGALTTENGDNEESINNNITNDRPTEATTNSPDAPTQKMLILLYNVARNSPDYIISYGRQLNNAPNSHVNINFSDPDSRIAAAQEIIKNLSEQGMLNQLYDRLAVDANRDSKLARVLETAAIQAEASMSQQREGPYSKEVILRDAIHEARRDGTGTTTNSTQITEFLTDITKYIPRPRAHQSTVRVHSKPIQQKDASIQSEARKTRDVQTQYNEYQKTTDISTQQDFPTRTVHTQTRLPTPPPIISDPDENNDQPIKSIETPLGTTKRGNLAKTLNTTGRPEMKLTSEQYSALKDTIKEVTHALQATSNRPNNTYDFLICKSSGKGDELACETINYLNFYLSIIKETPAFSQLAGLDKEAIEKENLRIAYLKIVNDHYIKKQQDIEETIKSKVDSYRFLIKPVPFLGAPSFTHSRYISNEVPLAVSQSAIVNSTSSTTSFGQDVTIHQPTEISRRVDLHDPNFPWSDFDNKTISELFTKEDSTTGTISEADFISIIAQSFRAKVMASFNVETQKYDLYNKEIENIIIHSHRYNSSRLHTLQKGPFIDPQNVDPGLVASIVSDMILYTTPNIQEVFDRNLKKHCPDGILKNTLNVTEILQKLATTHIAPRPLQYPPLPTKKPQAIVTSYPSPGIIVIGPDGKAHNVSFSSMANRLIAQQPGLSNSQITLHHPKKSLFGHRKAQFSVNYLTSIDREQYRTAVLSEAEVNALRKTPQVPENYIPGQYLSHFHGSTVLEKYEDKRRDIALNFNISQYYNNLVLTHQRRKFYDIIINNRDGIDWQKLAEEQVREKMERQGIKPIEPAQPKHTTIERDQNVDSEEFQIATEDPNQRITDLDNEPFQKRGLPYYSDSHDSPDDDDDQKPKRLPYTHKLPYTDPKKDPNWQNKQNDFVNTIFQSAGYQSPSPSIVTENSNQIIARKSNSASRGQQRTFSPDNSIEKLEAGHSIITSKESTHGQNPSKIRGQLRIYHSTTATTTPPSPEPDPDRHSTISEKKKNEKPLIMTLHNSNSLAYNQKIEDDNDLDNSQTHRILEKFGMTPKLPNTERYSFINSDSEEDERLEIGHKGEILHSTPNRVSASESKNQFAASGRKSDNKSRNSTTYLQNQQIMHPHTNPDNMHITPRPSIHNKRPLTTPSPRPSLQNQTSQSSQQQNSSPAHTNTHISPYEMSV